MASRVEVILDANTRRFSAAFEKAGGLLRGFLTASALKNAALEAIRFGAGISDAAARAQVSTRWIQEVGYAASQAGSSMEAVTSAVEGLRKSMGQALGGSRQDLDAFAALGLSFRDLQSLSPEQVFDRMAAAVARSGAGMREVNAAVSVMGDGSRRLIPMMADGFDEARQRAEEMGLVLSEDTVDAMDDLDDKLDTVTKRLKGFTGELLYNLTSLNNWKHLWELTKNSAVGLGKMAAGIFPGNHASFAEGWAQLTEGNSAIIDSYSAGESEAADERRNRRERRNRARAAAENAAFTRHGSGGGPQIQAAHSLARVGGYLLGTEGFGMTSLVRVQQSALSELRGIRQAVRESRDTSYTSRGVSW